MYVSGLSLRGIAKVVKADAHAVYRWILAYGRMNYEKPEPRGEAAEVELDEMWHYLHSKKQKSGYGIDLPSIFRLPSQLNHAAVSSLAWQQTQFFINSVGEA